MGNDEAAVPSTTLSPPPIAPVISVPTIPTPKPSMKRPTATASSPSQSSTADTSSVARAYNTHKLGLRIGGDAVAAGAAGVLVAPIITVIDRGIIENASGRRKLGGSVRTSLGEMVETRGAWFLRRPFGLVFLLYFGTYLTANTLDTISTTLSSPSTPFSATTAGTPKFLATSTTNLALCLYKDNAFTQMFGPRSTVRKSVPLPTFTLFTIRDCLTIFASFNLPTLLSPKLDERMGEGLKKYVGAMSVAQFATPAAVQIVSTPLHLLGLDMYNRGKGSGVSWGDRMTRVGRDWGVSALARMGRIVPAFGVGGVVNMKVRAKLMGALEEGDRQHM